MRLALTALIIKEFQQTFRDKRMVGVLVVVPLLQLVVLGYSVNLDVNHVPTLVADEDRSVQSRELVAGLVAGDAFDQVGELATGQAALGAFEHGLASIVIVVPKGFGERVKRGAPAAVQVLVDGSDSNRAIVAQNAATAYMLGRAVALAQERIAQVARQRGFVPQIRPLRVEPRLLYNPALDSAIFFVPGVAATLLLIVTLIVTAMGLAREKESGTLEQVLVTPLTPTTLILGKTLPYAAIGLVDLGLVLAAGSWLFGVPLRGPLVVVFAAGLLYLLATLGLGLFLAAVVRNQQQALMAAFFVLLPGMLLSGFVTPIENMPTWLRPVTALNPVRHFVEVLRAVLLKGASFSDLTSQFVALAGIGITLFGAASYTLRRRLG
jgi:ABC-2 type transport system permease protein